MSSRFRAPVAVLVTASALALLPWAANAATQPNVRSIAPRAAPAVPAFPGAVGFGANATGGRGGTVYHVTNLNDSGTGSLRAAVSTGPRIVVFDVGGYIDLKSPLSVKSNITIAGQSAPGQGVSTRGYQVSFSGSTNVIVRYMRFRHGLIGPKQDAVTMYQGSNQVFDHLSVSWGRDENFSINESTNITVQDSIIAEGLSPHSCGGLIQSTGVTLYQNLYEHNKTRNPKVKGQLQFVDNLVYDWGSDAFIEGDSAGLSQVNVVNNYFAKGPSTGSGSPFTRGNLNFHIYATGNYVDTSADATINGAPVTTAQLGTVVVEPTPFGYPQLPTTSARVARESLPASVGASLHRDSVDQRLISDLVHGTGKIITDPATVGGWGTLAGGTAPTDTDRDGMPDAWERANGLDPTQAADGAMVGPDGYSNVERYLNGLVR